MDGMISSGPELPPYTVTPELDSIRISGLSQNDRISLVGPGGISLVSSDPDKPTAYRIPRIIGLDVSAEVPEDTIILRFKSRGFGRAINMPEDTATRVDEWLAWYFAELREAQRITSDALRAVNIRRRS